MPAQEAPRARKGSIEERADRALVAGQRLVRAAHAPEAVALEHEGDLRRRLVLLQIVLLDGVEPVLLRRDDDDGLAADGCVELRRLVGAPVALLPRLELPPRVGELVRGAPQLAELAERRARVRDVLLAPLRRQLQQAAALAHDAPGDLGRVHFKHEEDAVAQAVHGGDEVAPRASDEDAERDAARVAPVRAEVLPELDVLLHERDALLRALLGRQPRLLGLEPRHARLPPHVRADVDELGLAVVELRLLLVRRLLGADAVLVQDLHLALAVGDLAEALLHLDLEVALQLGLREALHAAVDDARVDVGRLDAGDAVDLRADF